jgi:hypothetical protein
MEWAELSRAGLGLSWAVHILMSCCWVTGLEEGELGSGLATSHLGSRTWEATVMSFKNYIAAG